VASLPEADDTLYAGELEIRLADGLVLASGSVVRLSVREFELLVAMAQRIGAIATRDELYATVWGGELRHGDRSVDVYVSKLRGKLEVAMPDRRFIHTHPGFGYRFQPQPSAHESAPLAIVRAVDPRGEGEHLFTKCSHRDYKRLRDCSQQDGEVRSTSRAQIHVIQPEET
jgi:DNA-binding winged helix-turn-helix (wHTH) protein